MEAQGVVHKGDGKDVDHKRPIVKGGGTGRANLRIRNRSSNRSFPRTRRAGMKWWMEEIMESNVKRIVALLKKYVSERVQGFLMGVAVLYPGLIEFLTSYFTK